MLLTRVDDEVAVELADADRADVLGKRDVRHRDRGGRAVHREDVVGVIVLGRHRLADELSLVVPALGEERADRAVDHARGQGCLLAGASFAAEEGAGDLAHGVVAFLDIHREREEVDVAKISNSRGGEDHRVPRAHYDCT